MADKILIVEDEADILSLTKGRLERNGYRVIYASNGEEALKKAEVEVPDLILLDVVMPGKSGFEVCKILKTQDKTKFIPIVMFTSLGRDVDKKMGAEAGADGYILKPFDTKDLLAEVKRSFDKVRPSKFSLQLRLEHNDIKGKKILFEFDPSAPYERLVRDFALECVSHKERTIVLTKSESAIHQALDGDEGVEFINPTPDMMISSIVEKYEDGALNLVYDSLTNLALSTDSQAVYGFAQNMLGLLSNPKITAIFLINPSAHEPSMVSSLRSIFSNQMVYEKQGIVSIRFS